MPVSVNVTVKGLPVGAWSAHLAAKVEPQRMGSLPLPTPAFSGTVLVEGDPVTASIVPGIQYVFFGSDGKGRLVMNGMSQPTIETLTPAAGTQTPVTISVAGYGFSASSRVRAGGVPVRTRFKHPERLEADLPASAVATVGAKAITVENAGYITNAKTFTVS
jgi:hypothetical protein